jgi:hypothetical protein
MNKNLIRVSLVLREITSDLKGTINLVDDEILYGATEVSLENEKTIIFHRRKL